MRRVALGWIPSSILIVTLFFSSHSRGESLAQLAERLTLLENASERLRAGVERAGAAKVNVEEFAKRRFADGMAAFGVGNYADASIQFFDIVARALAESSESLFYLGESLFLSRNYLAASSYFTKLVDEQGEANPHYQDALQRLIEISVQTGDSSRVEDYFKRLEMIPEAKRIDLGSYVRGKYAFTVGNYDEAIRILSAIPRGAKGFLRALYVIGAAHSAKKEFDRAVKVFDALANEKTGSEAAQIIELAHLALGRLHYQSDRIAEALDHYSRIPRRSELFDQAVFETAWVHVKAKQFDKALRSLELLALANSQSAMLPEVKILEGNLRLNKARSGIGKPQVEYSRAVGAFAKTRDEYRLPSENLTRFLKEHTDPKAFFEMLVTRLNDPIHGDAQVPSLAIGWVRENPNVEKLIELAADLAQIEKDLVSTEQLLEQMDRVASGPSGTRLVPGLAQQTLQVEEIRESLGTLRQQIAVYERELIDKYAASTERAEIAALKQEQDKLARELAALPNSARPFSQRVEAAREDYVSLDKQAQEIEPLILALENELAAIDRFYHDSTDAQKASREWYAQQSSELRGLVAALRQDLASIRKDAALAIDEAGVGDDVAREDKRIRGAIDASVKMQHDLMNKIIGRMNENDRANATEIDSLIKRADAIELSLGGANERISTTLTTQFADVNSTITDVRGKLAEYRKSLEAFQAENVDVGARLMRDAFTAVAQRLYGITVRAELGILDISWAEKEEAKDRLSRLNLETSRAKKLLQEEFREVLAAPPQLLEEDASLEGTNARH